MKKGFGTSVKSPKQEIKNLRSSVRALSPTNIHNTVIGYREMWDADYPHRKHYNGISKESLLSPDSSREVMTDSFKPSITNKKLIGMKMLFMARCGHWSLHVQVMPNGKKEFSFNVNAGSVHTWHPTEAKNAILQHHDKETYRQWKRVVMSEWKEASAWLPAEASKALPGFKAWSVTSDASSTRLMKKAGIPVVSEVAFLFL